MEKLRRLNREAFAFLGLPAVLLFQIRVLWLASAIANVLLLSGCSGTVVQAVHCTSTPYVKGAGHTLLYIYYYNSWQMTVKVF